MLKLIVPLLFRLACSCCTELKSSMTSIIFLWVGLLCLWSLYHGKKKVEGVVTCKM